MPVKTKQQKTFVNRKKTMNTPETSKTPEVAAESSGHYCRSFARRQWRSTFPNRITFALERQPGRQGSFRHYTGRTKAL
jgi:hypothetical protein